MSDYGTKLAEGFSQKLMKEFYDKNLISQIANRDYEGDINEVGSKLNILNFDRLSEKTYANSALTADDLTENNSQLIIDQYKSFYWKEKTLARWLSYIKNPNPTIVSQVAGERGKNVDEFALGLYADVGAGNRVGTDVTGTLTSIVTVTGVVTSAGTEFTASMVGRPFKATGHDVWYRVKTYTSTSEIVIEDDLDDVDSAYTGGAIGAVAFTVQSATVLAVTTSNLLETVGKLKLALDSTETFGHSAVPDTDRVLIVPPNFGPKLVQASGVALHVPDVYQELVKKGMITMLQGFKVFQSNRLTGNNTDGWRVLAFHPSWLTFAEKTLQVRMEEDLTGDFGTAYKDLFVYGAKVTDARRHFATELYCTL
jgi:hypothetical protein